MGRVERGREIARRRSRKMKLLKLRKKFATAKDQGQKEELLAKVRRISPFMDLAVFQQVAAESAPKAAAKK